MYKDEILEDDDDCSKKVFLTIVRKKYFCHGQVLQAQNTIKF